MLLGFDGQLLGAQNRDFVSEEGRNKGQRYEWTELQFHNTSDGVFTLKTSAPVVIDPAMFGKPLHWDLQVVLKRDGKLRVTGVSGSKPKA